MNYSHLLTQKKTSRRKINNVLINFDYDFLNNVIKFNNIKIDNNKVGDQILNIIEEFEDNNLNNTIKTKRLLIIIYLMLMRGKSFF